MNVLHFFLRLYPGDAAAAAAGVLLLQATVAAFLGVALSALAGRHHPALRAAVGGCALAAILLSPLCEKGLRHAGLPGSEKQFSWVLQRLPFPAWTEFQGIGNAPANKRNAASASRLGQGSKLASDHSASTAAAVLRSIAGLALALWAVGSAGLFLGMIRGLFRLARIRRAAVRLSGRTACLAEEVAAEIGLPRTPPIYSSPAISSPWAAGLWNPGVLLPAPICDTLSAEQLREVFLHEFAHILRRDLWIGLAQRLSIAAFWPSPFVHWLNASLSRAREEVCDNYVLARVDASSYAQTLLRVATGMHGVPAAACAMGSELGLAERVSLLLDSKRNTMITIHKPIATLLLAGFVGSASWIGLCAEEPGAKLTPDKKPDSPAAAGAVSVEEPPQPAEKEASFKARWGNALNPDGDCRFSLDAGDLKIAVPGSDHAHDFAAELKNISGPSVTQKVKGDFTVSVKVDAKFFATEDSTEPTRWGYHGAGLLLLADKDNYITLQRAAMRPKGGEQFECLNYELRKDAKRSWMPSAENLAGIPKDVPLFGMRLEKKGKKLIASLGRGGDEWQVLWTDDLPDSWPDEIEVGVVAVSSSKEPFNPVYREYSLKPADAK